jgi:hypothetical protein
MQSESQTAMADFADDDLTNMLVFLVAEAEASVIGEDHVALMWLIACELHRRRCRKVLGGILVASPTEIVEDEMNRCVH